ncbi:MAG: thioredoxin [Clostridia bacterium]|nr:thioredoxin [Clostridia bacterium]
MTVITKSNFETEVTKHDGLVVIDFYADWCGPCKMLAPVVHELEAEYPDVKFCKVNVDDEPSLAAMFKVQSIPMIALVKNDTFVDFSVGYVPKAKLASLIEENK